MCRRLVEQQHLGPRDARTRQRDALPFASGKARHIGPREARQAELFEQRQGLGRRRSLGVPGWNEGQKHVLEHGHAFDEPEILEKETYLGAPHFGALVVAEPEMASPPSHTSPEVGSSMPPRMARRVVFPLPLGPRTSIISPRCRSSEIPFKTSRRERPSLTRLETSLAESAGTCVMSATQR